MMNVTRALIVSRQPQCYHMDTLMAAFTTLTNLAEDRTAIDRLKDGIKNRLHEDCSNAQNDKKFLIEFIEERSSCLI